jgi:hypothetical protein
MNIVRLYNGGDIVVLQSDVNPLIVVNVVAPAEVMAAATILVIADIDLIKAIVDIDTSIVVTNFVVKDFYSTRGIVYVHSIKHTILNGVSHANIVYNIAYLNVVAFKNYHAVTRIPNSILHDSDVVGITASNPNPVVFNDTITHIVNGLSNS